MKKTLLKFLTLGMAVVFSISATACSSATPLSFSDKWNNANSEYADHSRIIETLEYSVEYKENYNELIQKDPTLGDDVKLEYSNGKYTQVLTATSHLPDGVTNNFSPEDYKGSYFYHLHTALTVDVKVTDATNEETHTDTVVTDVYFLSAGLSFAPVWSHTAVDNLYIITAPTEPMTFSTNHVQCEWTFAYGQEDYTMTPENVPDFNTENTYEYDFKTVIDNAQLLFALRNITIEENDTFSLPTVSPSYGEAKTLTVYYSENANSTYTNRLTFTSPATSFTDKEVEVPVKMLKFNIQSTLNSGAYHYANIQKSATDDLPFRSLMTEYSAPIISYYSYHTLGAMVYKLTSVTIEQK